MAWENRIGVRVVSEENLKEDDTIEVSIKINGVETDSFNHTVVDVPDEKYNLKAIYRIDIVEEPIPIENPEEV